ncbi:MAG: hypothetical protein ISQ90_04635 [Rhodospirillales bacterium]|nr:hypothetical protein [Rhodospirillales bacterium]
MPSPLCVPQPAALPTQTAALAQAVSFHPQACRTGCEIQPSAPFATNHHIDTEGLHSLATTELLQDCAAVLVFLQIYSRSPPLIVA